jgi:molybdopterin-biosynthesis enzyme MoeA-like protein
MYNFDAMTATEIDNLKCKKELELKDAENNLHVVDIEELEIGKQIISLQMKRKDLQIALSKAKHIVKNLTIDIRIITSAFWKAKDGR